MELTRLSQITGDLVYYNTALRVQDHLSRLHGEYGSLVSHFLGPDGSQGGEFTIGGMIDRSVVASKYLCAPLKAYLLLLFLATTST
jgi:hypothetical protein